MKRHRTPTWSLDFLIAKATISVSICCDCDWGCELGGGAASTSDPTLELWLSGIGGGGSAFLDFAGAILMSLPAYVEVCTAK